MLISLNNTRRVLLTALILFFLLPGSGSPASAEEGTWSKLAYAIPSRRAFRIPSPDRTKTVLVQEMMLAVTEAGGTVPGIEGFTLLFPSEIAWASDSKAFVLTANEGGQDEAWYVTVFVLEYDRVNYYDVTAEAAGRFKERFACLAGDEPNIGAIKWLKESKSLLLVAEVPARASCSDKNARWGYIVEIPSGKVLSELEPKKLQDDWGEYLGLRFVKKSRR